MAEYIVRVPDDMPYDLKAELNAWYIESEPIVRCRDCKNYYEADNYHPQGNYISRCCNYFDTYMDEVSPDGFCAWGERDNERNDGQIDAAEYQAAINPNTDFDR